MLKKNNSSRQWIKRQQKDPFVKEAKALGLRSRAAIKLKQMQEKHMLIQSGMVVLDLGSSPGGWSELLAKWVGKKGLVIACDLLPMEDIPGVAFVQGNFFDQNICSQIKVFFEKKKADIVLCDIAPNFIGMSKVNHLRSIGLAEEVLHMLPDYLHSGGDFLIKVFQGSDFQAYEAMMRTSFVKIKTLKPKASREESNERYLLGLGFKGTLNG
jgi:23S rRNA (uridine2552-2'-O)-methyltransferase